MKHAKHNVKASSAGKRQIMRRTGILMAIFGIVMFIPLMGKLWYWQVHKYDEITDKAAVQQTSKSTITANRGTIYDTNDNILAVSSNAYDVIISPKAIADKQQEFDKKVEEAQQIIDKNKNGDSSNPDVLEAQETIDTYQKDLVDLIASELDELLSDKRAKASNIRKLCKDTDREYQKIAEQIDLTTEEAIKNFIDENHLGSYCVYFENNSKRYYSNDSLAAQVIGFTDDTGGVYGLESFYNDYLSETNGVIISAKNASGKSLMNFYQDYYASQNGSNLHTTLDINIQELCEKALADGIERYDVQNGGFAIAMDCNSGAILGMASSPTYNLNNPGEVTDSVLLQEIADGDITEADARLTMWRSKALNDTYEPGSTFKSLVLGAGIEEGLISETSTFTCTGSITLGDWVIKCSAHSGHGLENLAQAVGNSCNPAFITIGQSLGTDKFYSYIEKYGLLEKTGIDLPGESSNVIWDEQNFSVTQLATASFGQRFNVTPISLISAINSVINGGYLYKPYIVESITNANGETTYTADTTPVRQIISSETSKRCASLLEGVVESYTGKNAYVPGYRIGGKTGTSQTLVDDEYIVSFVGFAPADDPQVIVLLAFDSPKVQDENSDYSTTGYYISGGNMAAPIAGQLISEILDLQGFEKEYTDSDLNGANISVPNLVGKSKNDAQSTVEAYDLTCNIVGDGDTVTAQMPSAGNTIPTGNCITLYMGVNAPTGTVTVPDLTGMTVEQARSTLNNLDLYITVSGSSSYYTSSTLAYRQSAEASTQIERGSVITVYFADNSIVDYAENDF